MYLVSSFYGEKICVVFFSGTDPPSRCIIVVVVVVVVVVIRRCSNPRSLVADFRQIRRSVLFIRWFRAPFFSQVVYALGVLVVTSASDVVQWLRGAFASSTKYLRQSRWPYIAAIATQSIFNTSVSFFLQRNISRCLCDHFACCLYVPLLFPSLAKVSLCRKEIEDSRGVLLSSLFTRLSSSHGQLVREAVL